MYLASWQEKGYQLPANSVERALHRHRKGVDLISDGRTIVDEFVSASNYPTSSEVIKS